MAAVDFDDYLPFDAGLGAARLEDGIRKLFRVMGTAQQSGVVYGELNGLEAYGPGAGTMAVKVKSGRCLLEGHYGEVTTEKTVTLANPHATLVRLDLVIMRADYVANKIVLDVLTNPTPGSTTLPAVTQNSVMYEQALAKVTVQPGAAYALPTGDVLDMRRFTSERGPRCRVERSAVFTLATSGTFVPVLLPDEIWDPDGMHSTTAFTSQVNSVKDGIYRCTGVANFDANATGHRDVKLLVNGASTKWQATAPGSTTNQTRALVSGELQLDVGDYVELAAMQTSGGSLALASAMLSVVYIDPIVLRG